MAFQLLSGCSFWWQTRLSLAEANCNLNFCIDRGDLQATCNSRCWNGEMWPHLKRGSRCCYITLVPESPLGTTEKGELCFHWLFWRFFLFIFTQINTIRLSRWCYTCQYQRKSNGWRETYNRIIIAEKSTKLWDYWSVDCGWTPILSTSLFSSCHVL